MVDDAQPLGFAEEVEEAVDVGVGVLQEAGDDGVAGIVAELRFVVVVGDVGVLQEVVERDVEEHREVVEDLDRRQALAAFPLADGLMRHVELIGQFVLGQTGFFSEFGDAGADLF